MNSWSDNARRRKLARQAPAPTDIPSAPPARKDTKRWCGGKQGREHRPKCFQRTGYQGHWYDLCCTKCGKQLDYWIDWSGRSWGSGMKRLQQPRPDWVSLTDDEINGTGGA